MITARFPHRYLLALAMAALQPASAAAQSAVENPPNLANGWILAPGGIQFNLVHRFSMGPAPERKVLNAPTLTFAYGLTGSLVAGASWASASELVPQYPNEWEYFARMALREQDLGHGLDLFTQLAYNLAARSVDGQVTIARRMAPVRTLLAVGFLGDGAGDDGTRGTVGGGIVWRIGPQIAIAGDATTFWDRSEEERVAWSLGLQIGIARTPHTLSLHVTNVNSRTLQGTAIGTPTTRLGFEYTIPITLAGGGSAIRSTGHAQGGLFRSQPSAAVRSAPMARLPRPISDAPDATIVMRGLRYSRPRLEITAGTRVTWLNRDPVEHTVTATDTTGENGRFDSGPIAYGKSWSRTFDTPGTYRYHCIPHPHMNGVIVVHPRKEN